MYNSPAIHFKVMVVFSHNRRATLTFFGSPLRRRRNSDSVQFNRFNSAATINRKARKAAHSLGLPTPDPSQEGNERAVRKLIFLFQHRT